MFSTLLPPEGAKTLWEDRCILVHVDNAKDVSGSPKLLPSLLLADELPAELLPQRAAVYPPDASGDGGEDSSGRAPLIERLASHLQAAMRPLALGAPLAFIWSRFLSGCQPRAAASPLEWHPRRPLLAAADSRGRVQLLDLGSVMGAARQHRTGTGGGGPGGGEVLVAGPGAGCLRAVLTHEALNQQALSLSWSPTSPGLLAVGSEGAVGLWAIAGEARPPLAAAGRSGGPWLRLLRTRVAGARVTSLSWSPDGRLLAAASPNQAGLQVWDVASGDSTPVGAGPAAFDMVRWSPCGNYVFAAGTGSRYFYIFETQRWRWARWQTSSSNPGASAAAAAAPAVSGGGTAAAAATSVVAAAWAPAAPGRNPILLAALHGQSYLVAVHLVDSPPGLTAQLLPVALPELHRGGTRVGGGGAGARSDGGGDAGVGVAGGGPSSAPGSSASASAAVADLAWDPRGERLAVLLVPAQGQETHCVAVYGTITDPLVSARLIGLARPPQQLCEAAAAAAADTAATAPAAEGRADAEAAAAAAAREEAGPSEAGPSQPAGGSLAGGAAGQAAATAASLVTRPGALAVVCLAPLGGGSSSASSLPACVISARVGERGVYNLPCYL
ncbi:hypothetical protein PLESTB_000157600 [Pleodorina starrii]|uniref:Aladin n=1 Tax=Pleodorina starrii TaxID=330485 RepID=A0A9W6EYA2_9CHLO|nr:hypothetical protein PLESTM_000456000 [Pleodorina starrii]GLC48871.1 hypothetical protein PLESTB_000157600 [Pleodorina starrii]GLC72600.1 hypothetical protein PLESTF_001269000 [Pleodorina starrii]